MLRKANSPSPIPPSPLHPDNTPRTRAIVLETKCVADVDAPAVAAWTEYLYWMVENPGNHSMPDKFLNGTICKEIISTRGVGDGKPPILTAT